MKDIENLSKEHFNKQAAIYDETDTMYYSKMPKVSCRHTAEYLRDFKYESLLDVGCGTGYLLELLIGQKPADYHGLDLSDEMLRVAGEKNIPNSTFVLGTADKLPYEDGSFDVVTCIQSFHHYPYPDNAMKEALRVLKPDGIYLLSDTGMGGIGGWIENHLILPRLKSGDCRVEGMNGIAKMMIRNGFQVIDTKKLTGLVYTVIGKKSGKRG
ncbi:MAG: class I SAM-dependent methyltransferase [Coriobacteriales bacterium]|jgi:ubiquinone/menaquinone biosynthesis C-methylase UbiE|nr:class I SAM-dependent methyltransferase [Coriobacteriales bacterium]